MTEKRRLALELLVIVLCLSIFAALAGIVTHNQKPGHFDAQAVNTFYDRAQPVTTDLYLAISLLGSRTILGLGIGIGLFFLWQRRWPYLVIWAVALIGGELMCLSLKRLFARPRPFFEPPLAVEKTLSFPSSHAMMSLITYGLLVYLLLPHMPSRRARAWLILDVILLIGLIGFSRLGLSLHYPSDIVGGYAIGGAWLVACIAVWHKKLKTGGGVPG